MPQIILKGTERIDGVGAASTRKCILLLIFGVCISFASCDGPKVNWSAESRSPDGKMIAKARTIQTSGIGTGNPRTFVYLNWTKGPQVREIYSPAYPELTTAAIEGPEVTNETLGYRFVRAVGAKG